MDELDDLNINSGNENSKDEGAFIQVNMLDEKNQVDITDAGQSSNLLSLLSNQISSLGKLTRNQNSTKTTPIHLQNNFIPTVLSVDSLDYYMDLPKKGKLLIINNQFFQKDNLCERKGTEVDKKNLISCFSKLGFEIEVFNDKTVYEIYQKIHDLSKQDFSSYACFFCAVLTHGELNQLWAHDDQYFIDHLFEPFQPDKCKTLAGKPKVFLIQACRGDKLDDGMIVKYDDVFDSVHHYKIPIWSDFLTAYSTVPGYYSWRNTSNGSWFIQSFIAAMEEYVDKLDLLSILTIANYKVAYEFESFTPNSKDFDKRKQMPQVTHMLTKRLFLNKKNLPKFEKIKEEKSKKEEKCTKENKMKNEKEENAKLLKKVEINQQLLQQLSLNERKEIYIKKVAKNV